MTGADQTPMSCVIGIDVGTGRARASSLPAPPKPSRQSPWACHECRKPAVYSCPPMGRRDLCTTVATLPLAPYNLSLAASARPKRDNRRRRVRNWSLFKIV